MGRIAEAIQRPERIVPVLRLVAKRDWSSRLLTRALKPFNPLDPRRYSDPYAAYAEFRPHGPVFHHERAGNWLISGHAECEAVLRAPSSVSRAETLRKLAPYKHLSERSLEVLDGLLIGVDPPDHTRLRNLVSRAFTPKSVAAFEPDVRSVAAELLDEIDGLDRVDAMTQYATRLPIYVIGKILGLPSNEWERLKKISDTTAKYVDPLTGFDPGEMDAAIADMSSLLRPLIEARRLEPTDDTMGTLVAAADDGDRLSETELHSMITLLMVAGHETTAGLIANSLLHLDRHRDARTLLLERPDIAPNAIEELLRFDAPVQGTDRFPTEDLEVGGHTIPAGSGVYLMIGEANRDERVHDRPDELLLDRDRPRPLSFGHGIHHCIGAALARLEGQVAIPAFVERFPDYTVIEDDIVWKRSFTLKGPQHLPVQLNARNSSRSD